MNRFLFYQTPKPRKPVRKSRRRKSAEPKSPVTALDVPASAPVVVFPFSISIPGIFTGTSPSGRKSRDKHHPTKTDSPRDATPRDSRPIGQPAALSGPKFHLSDLWDFARTQRRRIHSPPPLHDNPNAADENVAGRSVMLAITDTTKGEPEGYKFVIHCALADVGRVAHWLAPRSPRRQIILRGKGPGDVPADQLETLVVAGFSPLTIEIRSEHDPESGGGAGGLQP